MRKKNINKAFYSNFILGMTEDHQVTAINLTDLIISAKNCRQDLTDEETTVRDLADDIKLHGLLNPLQVRPLNDKYEIICGQRRFLAIKSLGDRETIACIIKNISDEEAEKVSLAENIQRANLSTLDKVRNYAKLHEAHGRDINKLSRIISISPHTLRKYITIRKLPEELLLRLDAKDDDKHLTMATACALTSLPESQQVEVADAIQRLDRNDDRAKVIRRVHQDPGCNVERIIDEVQNSRLQTMRVRPTYPWIPGRNSNDEPIRIPEHLYEQVRNIVEQDLQILDVASTRKRQRDIDP